MTPRHTDAAKGSNRQPQWLGGPRQPLHEAEGMLRRSIAKELERRGLGKVGLTEVARTAGSSEADSDLEALRHWLAGRRNIRSDRVERALWALGVTEDDLEDLLKQRFRPIWFISLRTQPPWDERFVRAETLAEAVERAEIELGIKPERIRAIGPYDTRRLSDDLHAAIGRMVYREKSGVWLESDGSEAPDVPVT